MKYKNFDDFFSSIDINKNEMIDNWENLKKRKKKITIITTIVMITIILSLFYLICYNTKLIRLIIPMFILKIRMNRSGLRRNLQNRLFERWMILKF